MKRHAALETLSFEHHDALVIALRIKKGLLKNGDLEPIVEYVLSIYRNHLVHHFEQEEKTLVILLNSIPQTQQALRQMLSEHQRLAEIIRHLEKKEGNLQAHLNEFATLLQQHIRFEERTLFKLAEKYLTQEQLKVIGIYLHDSHKPINKNWQPEFLKD